jgi:hypothetical protein
MLVPWYALCEQGQVMRVVAPAGLKRLAGWKNFRPNGTQFFFLKGTMPAALSGGVCRGSVFRRTPA